MRIITFRVLMCALGICVPVLGGGQQHRVETLRVESSLTLIETIAEQKQEPGRIKLVSNLTKDDFQLFNDGQPVPIATFDTGEMNRGIALWLVVQCPDNQPAAKHSLFLKGHTAGLIAGLRQLSPADSVGVAHWCDNGTNSIDLPLGKDPAKAASTVARILTLPSRSASVRPGEMAMQKSLQAILDDTSAEREGHLPVLIFFHGDGAATATDEAHAISNALLSHSAMVFGVNDGKWPYLPNREELPAQYTMDSFGTMQQIPARSFYLIHQYAAATGGEVYSVQNMDDIPTAVSYIVAQLHARYTLGFRPPSLDGKPHTILVQLRTKATGLTLRYRRTYIPSETTKLGPLP